MGLRLRKMMEQRDWTQADLVRAAKIHMPIDPETGKPGRLSADNISSMMNGKRRPTRTFVKAVTAALESNEWLPAFIADEAPINAPSPALLTASTTSKGMYRVFIDREVPFKHARRILEALDDASGGEE